MPSLHPMIPDAMAVAREVARQILRNHVGRDEHCEDCAVHVAAAITEREQAVWREAADILSVWRNDDADTVPSLATFEIRFRERAAAAAATPPPRVGREGAQ